MDFDGRPRNPITNCITALAAIALGLAVYSAAGQAFVKHVVLEKLDSDEYKLKGFDEPGETKFEVPIMSRETLRSVHGMTSPSRDGESNEDDGDSSSFDGSSESDSW